ncbi:hypothetical protein SAMN04487846_1084 [Microbacterium sp. cf046]|uniref:hypothetical protein n=1 Tax=Microbacterium sp. cf046 TaxID=1761803 RepID=UPI0008EF9A17|nr:hypothetical protein [Microbacterium sp. cf046]SFR95056.1 hypothetical protein SAMN04487846_1084 [Microbacterium sp. cf046]
MTDPSSTTTGAASPRPATRVLELRVHGVNNTTPAALLDLPLESIELAAGDTLGSFWQPTPAALAAMRAPDRIGKRGHVPERIAREAYSWGGMVRTTPNFGGPGAAGKVVGVLARIFYAIILPFSIGNAAQWTRHLSVVPEGEEGWRSWTATVAGRRSRRTAGAARLFGLILTLLFTTTAATLALDVGAAQCAAQASLCGPLEGFFGVFADWTGGRRLALFALAPVAAVIVLWIVSSVSQVRYDVLPGMEGGVGTADSESGSADAVLSQPGFWSNRMTRYLARTHLSAAICLTLLLVGLQASMGWQSQCRGVAFDACFRDGAPPWSFWPALLIVAGSAFGLAAACVLAWRLPTMTIQTEEQVSGNSSNRFSKWLLVGSSVVFGVVLLGLAVLPTPVVPPQRLYGAGMALLVLAIAGAVVAISGFAWRPPVSRNAETAWSGRGPGVFMTISLAVALATSAIVVVTTGDFLNGANGPSALIGAASSSIHISRSFVALGTLIVIGLVVAVLYVLLRVFRRRRDLTARGVLWRTAPTSEPPARGGAKPPTVPDELSVPSGGVLPPSKPTLLRRIVDKRAGAARLHLVEPAVWAVTIAFVCAIVCAIVWTCWSYVTRSDLWGGLTGFWRDVIVAALDVGMFSLAWIGIILVGVLAAGATSGGSRPLGIVWDITCFLPRTGHPFGPPCYAERAVPEIAGRLHHWLSQDDTHRAILAAHSMGAVLSVSALGLLASSADTRRNLHRIALLTFGVQLRPFFGRMLPELLGPDVIGTHSCAAPRFSDADPWAADLAEQQSRERQPLDPSPPAAGSPAAVRPPIGRLTGALLPRDADGVPLPKVRWISLWRLTDYLGYPAFSTAPTGPGWQNHVDRYASELDMSGYMVEVGTHGEYYRVAEYEEAVTQLRDQLEQE